MSQTMMSTKLITRRTQCALLGDGNVLVGKMGWVLFGATYVALSFLEVRRAQQSLFRGGNLTIDFPKVDSVTVA